MRVFAISDLHLEYPVNKQWLQALPTTEYQSDALIVAGDVAEDFALLRWALQVLVKRFGNVFFVPGNHDLWVQNSSYDCSLEKFHDINVLCRELGVHTQVTQIADISFVPLLAWYDYSFAIPDASLRRGWRDYRACRWPTELGDNSAVNRYFLKMNEVALGNSYQRVISFSHFLPRLDLMPERIPLEHRRVYPVLGSEALGRQVAQLKPELHVYGHSHVNRSVALDGTHFVNNAFGNPRETRIARKSLYCVLDDSQNEKLIAQAKVL